MPEFSKFTSRQPAQLSKGFRLEPDGTLFRIPGGRMVSGNVERVSAKNIMELADVIKTLTPAQALGYGICREALAKIVTASLAAEDKSGTIARTREHFCFPEDGAFLMLDYDPPKGDNTQPLTPEDLRKVLTELCLELTSTPMLIRPSASSYIFNRETGEQLKGQGGLRCWIPVKSGTDIPRAGETLFKKLWLAGHGHIEISSAGTFLVRSLLDASVWQPERLDFCGGAACELPLEQRFPEPLFFNPDAPALNTETALPNLKSEEEVEYTRLVEAAKRAAEPEAERIREDWIESRCLAALKKENPAPAERPERLTALRDLYRRAIETKHLFGDFELISAEGTKVTVGQILDTPEQVAQHQVP